MSREVSVFNMFGGWWTPVWKNRRKEQKLKEKKLFKELNKNKKERAKAENEERVETAMSCLMGKRESRQNEIRTVLGMYLPVEAPSKLEVMTEVRRILYAVEPVSDDSTSSSTIDVTYEEALETHNDLKTTWQCYQPGRFMSSNIDNEADSSSSCIDVTENDV